MSYENPTPPQETSESEEIPVMSYDEYNQAWDEVAACSDPEKNPEGQLKTKELKAEIKWEDGQSIFKKA